MKFKQQTGHILVLGIGVFFVVGSITGLDLGTARRMGPGFFPIMVGALLCVLALLIIVSTWREPATDPSAEELEGRPDLRSFIGVIAGVAAFAFATPVLGVLPGAFLSVVCTGIAVPQLTLKIRVLFGVVVALVIWLIFSVGLGLPFVAIAGF